MPTITPKLVAPLVAIRYNRVSDDKKKLSRSVTEQDTEGLAASEENGWADGGSVSDNDMSASRFAGKIRKQWVRLVEDILPAGGVDILVLWEPSRGSRVLSAWALLLEACQRLGVKIHITSHEMTYNLRNPKHFKTLADDGVAAVYESELTSQRVKRNLNGFAATGKPHGMVLYGYSRIYNDQTKEYLGQRIVEEQAAVIRDAVQWVNEGKSLTSLVKHLNDRGSTAPRGGRWSHIQIKKTMLNPSYIARRVHRGVVIGAADWPAILETKDFLDCKRILTSAGRGKRPGAVRHLLSGIARCSRCGGSCRVQVRHGSETYICTAEHHVTMRKPGVDSYVQDVVIERLSRPDFLDVVVDDSARDAAAVKADAEVQRLRDELEECYQQAESPNPDERLSPLGLARMERMYVPQIEAAEGRALSLRVPPVLLKLLKEDVAEFWPTMELTQQREVIRTLMTVTIHPAGRGRKAPPEERVKIEWKQLNPPDSAAVTSL